MVDWEGLNPPYGTIVADPPWHYDEVNPPNPSTGYKGGGSAVLGHVAGRDQGAARR